MKNSRAVNNDNDNKIYNVSYIYKERLYNMKDMEIGIYDRNTRVSILQYAQRFRKYSLFYKVSDCKL